jgi:uncharacterized SAM-binding protein YcdF (DUF218 family)
MTATALVVLGCRVLPSGRPGPAAERRAEAASVAWHDGVAQAIVTSGGRRWGDQIEASVLRRELIRRGVPQEHVREELCSLSTRENALFSTRLLRRLGFERAVVVTCDWHMARALASFEAFGMPAAAWPAHSPPARPWTRAARWAHEVVSTWLDRTWVSGAGLARAEEGWQ